MSSNFDEKQTSEGPLSEVVFSDLHGRIVRISLSSPVVAGSRVRSPFALCRMCTTRLPVRTLEKVLLCMFLDDAECGYVDGYSYDELAGIVGKGSHSIKNAIAALKKSGLVLTSCAGKGCARIAVSVEAFVRWGRAMLPTGPDIEPEKACSAPNSASGETVGIVSLKQPGEREGAFSGVSEDLSAKTVRKGAKRRSKSSGGPVAKKEGIPAAEGGSGGADQLAMAAPYEDEFDATEEIADTLRVAGRSLGEDDDDEDVISLGSETAETDMGHGVRMNVNI